MKKIIVLIIISFLFSCSENKNRKINKSQNLNISNNSILNKDNHTDNKLYIDLVNHFFQANGGSNLYLKNGDVKGCAKCDFDNNFVKELLKTETYSTYKDFDNYIIGKDSDTLNFFDENGKILSDWKILKGIPIENEMSIISYSSNDKSKNIESINNTGVLIFQPELKTFKDENSKEADAYFTAMDDWSWYSNELEAYFEKYKVKTYYLKKRFLSLKIENKLVIIDTKKPINNANVLALLYKKNKRPIILYLIPNDNDEDLIKEYLKK